MRGLLQDWVAFIFGGPFKDAADILLQNPSTGDYAGAWDIACAIYETACVPIGLGLVLIYFIVNVMEKCMQQQQFDLEQIVKSLIKLVICMYFIENGLELMSMIYSLGLAFVASIMGNGADGETSGAEQLIHSAWTAITGEEWEGEKWGIKKTIESLPYLLTLILPWALSWILVLVVKFVCFFRLIELYVQVAMAPVAMSDFFADGMHSNGWKFVKNFIALSLQMGIMLVALAAFNGIAASMVPDSIGPSDGLGFILKYLALEVACAAVLLKSRSLAKEIVGAQ